MRSQPESPAVDNGDRKAPPTKPVPRPASASARLRDPTVPSVSPAATNVNSALESMSGASTLSRFDLGREIGRGGMAVVHAAVDRETGQRVALKLIERSGGAEESRFVREVKAAIGLNHPGVCRTIAFGTDSTSMFLAMEFVDGDTLNSLAKRASQAMEFGPR